MVIDSQTKKPQKATQKYELTQLLSEYKTQKDLLPAQKQYKLCDQLNALIKIPVSKMLKFGWKTPHGLTLYARDRFEFEDLVQEGTTYVLEKIDKYNTEFSATTFVYLKLEERFRSILSKQTTPFTMSKNSFEQLSTSERTNLISCQSVEELLTEKFDENSQKKSYLPHHTEDFSKEILSNSIISKIEQSQILNPTEKEMFYLIYGIYTNEVKNSEIEQFTNGQVTSNQYRNMKREILKKIKMINSEFKCQTKSKNTQKKPNLEHLLFSQDIQINKSIQNDQNNQIIENNTSKKQKPITYQILEQFPIKSKFYLQAYKPTNSTQSAIEKKLIKDISQIIQNPLAQALENNNTQNQQINNYQKEKIIQITSKKILDKINPFNQESIEKINTQIQIQFNQIMLNLEEIIENTKSSFNSTPKTKQKPISQKIKQVKRKKRNNKSKKKKT